MDAIPLGLDVRYETRPFATVGLIFAMVTVYALTWDASPETLRRFTFDPQAIQPWQPFTAAMLHANMFHLAFNGLFLWVFGRYAEERLGPWRFLVLFFVLAGFAALVYAAFGSGRPALGASGGVAGLMGLVLVTAPKARVLMAWRSMTFWRFHWRIPAWILLGVWIVFQVVGVLEQTAHGTARVGYSAHIGGFLAGVIASLLMRSILFEGTGWYLPTEIRGGDHVAQSYHELTQSEAAWRMVEQHLRKQNRRG